ncbi:hypothetical protein QAD02_021374 [Eretmocerus hayati]|uniref:Uncharacterized protein n=1 Tax=Eretmocerus hayati TaxID=131215 RepID=A0ACC2PPZ9_9HYME|nr:hypothetical protein QAD02_021374 [Eretmocerus hayati]
MFACPNCALSFANIFRYNEHQKVHDKQNQQLLCAVKSCKKQFTAYNSFKRHFFRNHHEIIPKCLECMFSNCNAQFRNKKLLLAHVKSCNSRNNSLIQCKSCLPENVQFLTMKAYQMHFSRHHKYRSEIDQTAADNSNDQMNTDPRFMVTNLDLGNNIFTVNANPEINENLNETVPLVTINAETQGNSAENACLVRPNSHTSNMMVSSANNKKEINPASKLLAGALCKLTAKHVVVEPAIQVVVENVYSAYELCKTDLLLSINSSCEVTQDQKLKFTELFDSSFKPFPEMLHPGEGLLRNTYQRKQFFVSDEDYVPPIMIDLLNENGQKSGCQFAFVSPLKTISVMLRNENVRKHCGVVNVNTNNNKLCDAQDGQIVKNNQFFMMPNRLRLNFFCDTFDICCPIGPSKTIHKINGVYMRLMNLPPWLRSKVENMKLVQVCHDKYISQFGWKEVSKAFMADLSILETIGIDVKVNDVVINYKGSLSGFEGDNAGSHDVGGFPKGFSRTIFFCRFCPITLAEFLKDPQNRKPLRTPTDYDECALKAEATNKPCCGIRCRSFLNDLNYYHAGAPGLPPCIDHDVNLGLVAYDMRLVIKHFVKERWFKIGFLNFRLNDIKVLKRHDCHIPIINLTGDGKKLVGSMAQMAKLILIFPLAIVDRVRDFHDPVWKMVLTLRRMHALLFAPALSRGQLSLLEGATQDYMEKRVECFPEVNRRPEHEYTSHGAELTHLLGPLKYQSSKTGEHKHGCMKKIVKKLGNYKNVTKTIAERHQLMEISNVNEYTSKIEPKGIFDYDPNLSDPLMETAISQFQCETGSVVTFIAEEVKYRGIEYAQNDFVCIDKNEYGNFILCQIQVILLNADVSDLFFLGHPSEIIECREVGVYEILPQTEVTRLPETSIYPFSSLLSPDPIIEAKIGLKQVFLMKYAPFDPSPCIGRHMDHPADYAFKVVDASRTQRKSVIVKHSTSLLSRTIYAFGRKLNVVGASIVLEEDGTEIDEDELLVRYKDKLFMLLTHTATWEPAARRRATEGSQSQPPSANTLNQTSAQTSNGSTLSSRQRNNGSRANDPAHQPISSSTQDHRNQRARNSRRESATNGSTRQRQDRERSQSSSPQSQNAQEDSDEDSSGNDDENAEEELQDNEENRDEVDGHQENRQVENRRRNEQALRDINLPWANYQVPYKNSDCKTLADLQNGVSTRKRWKRLRTKFVHRIVDDLRAINISIPEDTFERIALTMSQKYPKIFTERFNDSEDGEVIGNGVTSLVKKMLHRNYYLNRPEVQGLLAHQLRIPLWGLRTLRAI